MSVSHSHGVARALNTFAAAVRHVGINHRRSRIAVAEKLVHRANIIAWDRTRLFRREEVNVLYA